MFGDSFTGNAVTALSAVLASRVMDATVYDEHANASGLVTPILGLDPLESVRQKLDAHPDATIAVFQWAGACARPCPMAYGSDAFINAWYAKAQQIVDLRSRGVTPVWTIPPPPPPGPGDPNGQYHYNEGTGITLSWKSRAFIYAAGLGYVDWWEALMGKTPCRRLAKQNEHRVSELEKEVASALKVTTDDATLAPLQARKRR